MKQITLYMYNVLMMVDTGNVNDIIQRKSKGESLSFECLSFNKMSRSDQKLLNGFLKIKYL